jgi:hypothetical protein
VPLRILKLRHVSGEDRVLLAREASGQIAEHGTLSCSAGPAPAAPAWSAG